jgi:oxygen-independent coproporphyrinogen III oxidase
MAGVYLHIPFCRQKCHYCNFHFTTSLRYKNELVNALVEEITLREDYLAGEPVGTVYFGGGTPSLLNMEDCMLILERLRRTFTIQNEAEVTLEANPDDITEEKLRAWKQAGINRLSIGVQSFFDKDLQWMNRAHNAEQAIDNTQLARQYFENITLDLIYGLPGMTHEKWEQNVRKAIACNIPHLSCYALTVEVKTPLDKMIREKKTENIDPDKQAAQFLLLMKWTEEAGYDHYEISNFARPGYRSRHNSLYWSGQNYLGLGPSAHSFNRISRQWNIANNNLYIESIRKAVLPFEIEVLTATQKLNEYIMTSLRTMEGLDLAKLEKAASLKLQSTGKKYIEGGKMFLKNGHLILTREGKLLADGIAADLFF